jgi:hypothetical protein
MFFKKKTAALPDVKLLKGYKFDRSVSPEHKQTADKLQFALSAIGINGKIVKIIPTPVTINYKFVPSGSFRFSDLEKKISRAFADKSCMIYPLPRESAIAISVPEHSRSIITTRNLIENKFMQIYTKCHIA